MRHREEQGSEAGTLRAAADASIIAEESGKTRGHMSCEEVQEPTAAPLGWLNGSTFGVFLDAVK